MGPTAKTPAYLQGGRGGLVLVKGGLLGERLLDLLRRRRIFFGPCNHARRIAPSEVQRIGYGGHLLGVAPEHGHISPFYALVVTLGEHIPGCLPCVACAVLQPLDVHLMA